ncbi:MAG: zinc ribbon domain-containing protein [Bacteroidaceae bacterium]|nr:zinc ribbon domain-containing protein [Bacteroidaceae bacterium]
MALIKCKECGQMISDKAVKCPNCGSKIVNVKRKPLILSVILVLVVVLGFCLVVNLSKSEMSNIITDKESVSDLKRMELNGLVKELEVWKEFFGSESEYFKYCFDEKGMLSKTQNESIGYSSKWGVGFANTCIYKNGKLEASTMENYDGSVLMFNYEYRKVDDTQTDVYRINVENKESEKAKSLFFDENGTLIKKVIYYDNQPIVYEYNNGILIDDVENGKITQKDNYGNWLEMNVEEYGYKIIRKISYY